MTNSIRPHALTRRLVTCEVWARTAWRDGLRPYPTMRVRAASRASNGRKGMAAEHGVVGDGMVDPTRVREAVRPARAGDPCRSQSIHSSVEAPVTGVERKDAGRWRREDWLARTSSNASALVAMRVGSALACGPWAERASWFDRLWPASAFVAGVCEGSRLRGRLRVALLLAIRESELRPSSRR